MKSNNSHRWHLVKLLLRSGYKALTRRSKKRETGLKVSNNSFKTERSRVVKLVLSCRTSEQLNTAKKYIKLAGFENDPIINEWVRFKMALNRSI